MLKQPVLTDSHVSMLKAGLDCRIAVLTRRINSETSPLIKEILAKELNDIRSLLVQFA